MLLAEEGPRKYLRKYNGDTISNEAFGKTFEYLAVPEGKGPCESLRKKHERVLLRRILSRQRNHDWGTVALTHLSRTLPVNQAVQR
jgi:hypothetical protein